MTWTNLKEMLCPYCNANLSHDIEVRCTQCFFHIDKDKFLSIIANRGFPTRKIQKLKWQNLRDDKCPICEHDLIQNIEGVYDIMKCSDANCTFKIRNDKFFAIILDENHPANRFYKPIIKNHDGAFRYENRG